MDRPKVTIKGNWIKANELFDFIYQLHSDARTRHDSIAVINNPDRERLKAIMLTLASIVEFTKDKIYHGNLRLR